MQCDAAFEKGDELGWFQHGSTILIFVPESFSFAEGIEEGRVLKMGEALMRLPGDKPAA
jgi:phosphatidylserine decarboxylase